MTYTNSLFAYLSCPQLHIAPMLQLGAGREEKHLASCEKFQFPTLYVLPLAVGKAKNSCFWQLKNSINLILQVLFLQEQVFPGENVPFVYFKETHLSKLKIQYFIKDANISYLLQNSLFI